MRIPPLLAAIFLACAVTLASFATQNSSEHWTILPTSEGKELIGQCSRDCPYDAKSFWRPSRSEVAAIEQRLPAFLRTGERKIKFARSYRQYLGIVRGSKKLIYINAFDTANLDLANSWRTKAIVICGGGEEMWGVEYDPASKTFQNLAVNVPE